MKYVTKYFSGHGNIFEALSKLTLEISRVPETSKSSIETSLVTEIIPCEKYQGYVMYKEEKV